MLVMTILAVFIVMLCLCSVSAVDDGQLNSTLETVNEISQDENIVISEINNTDDAGVGDTGSVSVKNEKNGENLLKASSNEDVLGADLSLTVVDGTTVTAGTPVTFILGNHGSVSDSSSVYLQFEGEGYFDNQLSENYGTAKSTGAHYTFTETGTFNVRLLAYSYSYYFTDYVSITVNPAVTTEETDTSISVNPTTVAPNNLITITPAVTKKGTSDSVAEGIVKFFYGDGTEMGEIDLATQTSFDYTSGFAAEGTYNVYAVYQANDNYAESTSSAVSVLVSQDTSKTPVTVTCVLSETGVAPGETFTVTTTVKNSNNEDVTGTVNLYDGNDVLIASDVVIGNPYTVTASQTSGDYKVYAQYLGNDDLAYAPGTSSKYDYKVKKQVQITLTASANEVTPSSYGGTSVTFTISCSETLPALKLYLNDAEFSTVSAGSTSTSISFKSSNVGLNTVYVYLAEDENFAEAKSNTESVAVFTTVSVTPSVTLNQSNVVEGEKILITATANNNAPGTITIYSDSSYQNEIATIPVGESYEYSVPVTEGSSSYYTGYIYAYYNGYDDGYTRYTHNAYSSGSKSFIVLRQNNAVLTGNGKTDVVEINFGDSVILHIDLDYWKQSSEYDSSYNKVYVSNVVIYLDGQEFDSFEVNRESSGYYDYTYSIADYTITFGDDGDEGTHTIYAYYKGSNEYGSYYAPATSNELTVNVKTSTVATTTTLTASNTSPKYGDKITITPSVNNGEVTTGSITYYIGETAISKAMALNTPFEYTIDGVDTVIITGKFAGEGYEASEGTVEISPVKADNNIVVTATTVDYPNKVNIKVTADVEGTYTVTIGDKPVDVVANSENGVDYQLAASDDDYTATVADWTHQYYEPKVTPATFKVNKGVNKITVGATDSVTYPDEVTITVTADVAVTYNVKVGNVVIPVVANGEGVKYKFAASETPYMATVDDWTSENYTASVTSAAFTVSKGSNNIAVIVDENNYLPGDVTVKVTADVDGIYTVSIGENTVDVKVKGGEGTNTISLPAGENYQAKTAFADDVNYTVSLREATFNVLKSDVELKIIVNEISAGDAVSGTVIASVPGTYSVKIADKDPFDVEVTGTSKEFTSGIILPIGEDYVAKVSISNNPNYNDFTNQTTFKVIANAVDFKASSSKSEYVYGEEVILTYELPEGADGEITFTYSSGATGEAGKITVPGQIQLSLGILDAKEYSIQAVYDGGSLYESSTKTVNFKVAQKANDVTVAIENVEYGKPVTVELSNAVEGTYTVNVNGKPVTVEVGSDGSGSATANIDLAVGSDYKATVSLDNDNYITSGETTFNITHALNEITVTVNPSDVAYGGEITVTVEASVPDVYEVDVAGQIVKVNVEGTSASNTTTVNADVGDDYEAKVAWSNANYTAKIQNAKFHVVKAVNNVEITIESVVYSSQITVKVKADKAGTYTVKLDDTHSVDVVVSADGKTGQTIKKVDLAVNTYQATTSFDNTNYDTKVSGGEFKVTPAVNTVKITVESPVSYGDEVTLTVEATVADTYTVTIGDKTVDVKVEDTSKKVTVPMDLAASETAYTATTSWENANYTLQLTEGYLTVNPKTNKVTVEIADVTLPDEVTVNVTADVAGIYRVYFDGTEYVDVDVEANVKKSVTKLLAEGTYNPSVKAQFENANYTMDYSVTESFKVNPEEIADDLIRILDYDYQANSTITIVSDGNVTIRVVYYLEEPAGSYYYGQEVRLNIGGQIKSVSPTYNQWTGFTYEFNETKDVTVSARYIALNLMGENIDVTSNELTYHIIINEPVENNISIESKEVNYATKANLTVTGTDGEYTVTVDKDYDVTVQNGTGYVIIDVLAGSKTYDVTIVSKTNSSLTNKSTLTVNSISPELTISATNTTPIYGEAITISADKNAGANGIVKFYEGDKEVTVADVILAGGKHIITAKYTADGNFTDDSAEIEINVGKAQNELNLEVTSPTYPENVTITLKATVPGDYDVIIAGNPYTVTVADNGVGTKSVRLIPNELYTAAVNYQSNGNYSDNSAECTFKVSGNTIGLNATISEKSIEMGQSIDLNSSSKISEATGKVTYSFDDGTADIAAEIGEVISYTPKTAGKHTISVKYDDGIFDPETVTLTVVVSKKQNNIKVEVISSAYPENVTVKVTADVEGDYVIDINGSYYTVTANGDGKSIKLGAGSYYANITYSDDEYDGITTNTTFEVKKGTNNVKVEVSSVELPSKVIAYITADVAGTYKIYFDEDNYVDIEVNAGEKTASKEYDLASGNYTTSIEFSDANYTNDVVNAEFEVTKIYSEFELILNTTEFTFGDEVIIKFTLPSDANGKVTFRYANGTVAGEKEVGNGLLGASLIKQLLKATATEYEYSLGKLPAGEYKITAEYSGDEKYKNASQTVDIKVVADEDINLIIRDANYPANETIKVVLEAGEKFNALIEYFINKPSEVFYPQIIIYINGQRFVSISEADGLTYDRFTNIGGYIAINETGVYSVQAEYKSQAMLGIPEIDVFSNTYTYDITVKDDTQTVSIEVSSVVYPDKANVTVRSNVDDNFTVDINGTTADVEVVNGTGSVLVALPAGNYTVVVTSKTNSSIMNSTDFTVFEEDVQNIVNLEVIGATYPDDVVVNVNATLDGTYTVDINGTKVDVSVVSGKGSNTVKLDAGDYVAKLDNVTLVFTVSKGKNNVVVSVDDVKLPSQVTVKVTADVDGTYAVDVNGTKVDVNVVDGQGSKSVSLDAGIYYANASWSNSNYDVEIVNDTFAVNVSDSASSLIIRDANYPNNATITLVENGNASIVLEYYVEKPDGSLLVDSLEILVNGNHLITVDNPANKAFTNIGGAIVINETQDLTFTAKYTAWVFMGNQYESVSNSISYHITVLNETEQTVSVDVSSVVYPDKANVTIRSNVDDNFTVDINGTTVDVEVVNGTGSVLVALPAGNYTVVVTSKTNSSIMNSTDFIVFEEDVVNVVSLDVVGATYPDDVVVNVNATLDGTYTVDINGTKVDVSVVSGKGSNTVKLDVGSYVAKLGNVTQVFTVSKGKNNVVVIVDDVKLPSQVTVKVTADVDDIYSVDVNGTKVDVNVVDGQGSKAVSLDAGIYYANVSWSSSNYDVTLTNDTFTVNESVSSVDLIIRDANYPANETIKVVLEAGEKFNALVEYFVNQPSQVFYPQIIIYINGQRFVSISEADGLNYDRFTNIGGFITINETGVYSIQAEYKSQAMLGIPEIDVWSNTYTYDITVKDDTQTVSVEVSSVVYPDKANVTVRSNVDDNFTVDINGITVDVEVVNGTGSVLVALPAGNYTAVATSKTNSSIVNSTDFTVFEEDVVNVISLDVAGAVYPGDVVVNVNATLDGTYTVDINGTKVDVNVVSGKGSNTVKLDTGDYVAKVDNVTVVFTVSKGKNNVKVSVEDVKLPSQVTVKVTADVDGTYTVDVNGTEVSVNVVDGEGSKAVSLDAGSYYANVSWSSSNYDVTLTNDTFTVNESDSSSSLVIRDANYPNNATITIVENGNVSIVLEYYVEKPEGNLLVDTLEIMVNGNHLITVDNPADKAFTNIGGAIVINETQDLTFTAKYTAWVFMGNQYESVSNSISYHITVLNETIQTVVVEVADVKYPDKANVTVKSDVDGNFTVDINGTTVDIEVVNGSGYALLSLPVGNYTAVAISKTNASIKNQTSFRVYEYNEASGNITIVVDEINKNATIDIDMPGATGNVSVIIDGKEFTVPLVDGKLNYPVDGFASGNHSIVVIYEGDDEHKAVHSVSGFTIAEDPVPEPVVPDVNVTVPSDVKAGESANVTVSVSGATGNVSVIIDGVETVVPLDENGNAVIPIENLTAGEHSVVVVYDGDDTYAGFHKAATFAASVISSDFVNVTVDGSGYIDAVLVDSMGNPIANATVVCKINGAEANITTDENGWFLLKNTNNAIVEFSYAGSDFIEPANVTINLQNIAPSKTATVINSSDFTQYSCDYYEGERGGNFTFQLLDMAGNPLANKTIYIGYNGVTLNRTTDANGYAAVQINLKNAGLYTFVVVFLGDENYNASMAVQKIVINKKTTSISASAKTFKATAKTKKYTVTLKTIKGSSIDGKTYLAKAKKVTLKINGKTYTAKTNAKGQATFSLKITKKGKFTAKISFAGDKSYEAASKSVKITIK